MRELKLSGNKRKVFLYAVNMIHQVYAWINNERMKIEIRKKKDG